MNAGNGKILVFAVRVAEIPPLPQAVATSQRSCFRSKATGVSTGFCGDTRNSFPLPILSFRESNPSGFPATQRTITTTSILSRNYRTEPGKTLQADSVLGFIRFLTMSRQASFSFTLKNNSLRRTVFTKVGEIFSKLSFKGSVFRGNRD